MTKETLAMPDQTSSMSPLARAVDAQAIPLDAQVPTFMLIGEHGRDLTRPSRENAELSVRMLEPTLEIWGVPYYRLEGPEDAGNFGRAYRQCQEQGGPVAVLVGAPTSESARRQEKQS